MRKHEGSLATGLIVSAVLLTGGCVTHEDRRGETPAGPETTTAAPHSDPASPPTWRGKEDQEDAIQRATRALNTTEAEGAQRIDEGMANLARGLGRTFTAEGRPRTLDIACQAPAPHSITLTLTRGTAKSEWEVTCGDREADQFNIPAGGVFTAHVPPAADDTDGLVMWRLNAVHNADVTGCDDDIKGCED